MQANGALRCSGLLLVGFNHRFADPHPSKIFADHNISFDKVSQKEQLSDNKVPIIIISDPINELNMQNALKEARCHEEILDLKIIRIED